MLQVSSFEFKKVVMSAASRVVSLVYFPSHSKSQKTSPCRVLLGGLFLRETPLLHLSQLLEQDFQPHRPEIPEGAGGTHEGQDDTVTPLYPLQNRSDLPPSSTRRRSRLSNRAAPRTTASSFATSSRVSSSGFFSPPPASHSLRLALLSSSTPIFALTLVIGRFLTVSLLLLSHSGASVVAVENGYPCLFFFVITQIKIPMN